MAGVFDDSERVCLEGLVVARGEDELSSLRRLKNRFNDDERPCRGQGEELLLLLLEVLVPGRLTICIGEIELIRVCFSSSVNGVCTISAVNPKSNPPADLNDSVVVVL